MFIIYCLRQDFHNEQFMRLNVQKHQHEIQRVTHFFDNYNVIIRMRNYITCTNNLNINK